MLSRLPWTPKPSGKKLKARDRGAAARRETMTAAVIIILSKGEPTKFYIRGRMPARAAVFIFP